MATLLLIDDSDAIRREIRRIVEKTGDFVRFLEARNGVEGLRVLAEAAPAIDVIVCDMNMPQMDGYKFLRAVRGNEALAHLPVVMVTSESEVEDMVKAFNLGASDYITKPVVPAILKARLKNMLKMKQLQDQLRAQKDMMERLATTDPLTEISNVRYFRNRLETELSRARRYIIPLSVLMIDIDHFKLINDTYGHPQGDAVLKEVAGMLQRILRNIDLAARYGGEEFVVALPQTTSAGAALAAERLRSKVEEHRFAGFPDTRKVTISVGVASLTGDKETAAQELIHAADQALYRAKKKGRNRVEVADGWT